MATIDRNKVAERVRFLMGDVSENQLSQETLLNIIEECITIYGDDDKFECEVTYCALLKAIRYMINKQNSNQGGDSGTLVGSKEKVGELLIEKRFSSDSSSNGSSGWEKMYDYYLKHPEDVCPSLVPDGGSGSGLVLIGGVEQDEYERVQSDPNSRNAYDYNVSHKYNPRRTNKLRRYSNSSIGRGFTFRR